MVKKINKDDRILELIKLVNDKKKEIASIQKCTYKTNCMFSYSDDNNRINLNVIQDVAKLYNIYAFLTSVYNVYTTVSNGHPFIWSGYDMEAWRSDIMSRISFLELDKKRKELKMLEDRLDKIISPELRQQMELEAIEKELGL